MRDRVVVTIAAFTRGFPVKSGREPADIQVESDGQLLGRRAGGHPTKSAPRVPEEGGEGWHLEPSREPVRGAREQRR